MSAPDEIAMTPLAVARAQAVAEDIHLLELRLPGGGELAAFTPGAHVSVKAPNGLVRKYSLCNDPAERDFYHIAVKREVDGRGGSASMIDEARAGSTLHVSSPRND